jgi:hypothetical protein
MGSFLDIMPIEVWQIILSYCTVETQVYIASTCYVLRSQFSFCFLRKCQVVDFRPFGLFPEKTLSELQILYQWFQQNPLWGHKSVKTNIYKACHCAQWSVIEYLLCRFHNKILLLETQNISMWYQSTFNNRCFNLLITRPNVHYFDLFWHRTGDVGYYLPCASPDHQYDKDTLRWIYQYINPVICHITVFNKIDCTVFAMLERILKYKNVYINMTDHRSIIEQQVRIEMFTELEFNVKNYQLFITNNSAADISSLFHTEQILYDQLRFPIKSSSFEHVALKKMNMAITKEIIQLALFGNKTLFIAYILYIRLYLLHEILELEPLQFDYAYEHATPEIRKLLYLFTFPKNPRGIWCIK